VWAMTVDALGRAIATGPFGPLTTAEPPTGTEATATSTVPVCVGFGVGGAADACEGAGVCDPCDGVGDVWACDGDAVARAPDGSAAGAGRAVAVTGCGVAAPLGESTKGLEPVAVAGVEATEPPSGCVEAAAGLWPVLPTMPTLPAAAELAPPADAPAVAW
jgi:hypothetical protein